jgi:serine/threonine protein kinase
VDELLNNLRLSMTERLKIIESIVKSIEALHNKHFVHRDLKWENVFYFKDAKTGEITVKLSDFDLSSLSLNVSGCLGTFDYMAPEIFKLEGNDFILDGRPSDIYSFSIMITEILGAQYPIFPKMANINPNKRPKIGEVKSLLFEFEKLQRIIAKEGKIYVSDMINDLDFKEKIFIVDSVISQVKDLHETGSSYESSQLKWENVLYIKDPLGKLIIKLKNFGEERFWKSSNDLKRFGYSKDHIKDYISNSLELCEMINSIFENSLCKDLSSLEIIQSFFENFKSSHFYAKPNISE